MKLSIITEDGDVVETIENVEQYQLNKSMARAMFLFKIEGMIKRAHTEKDRG